MHRGLDGETVFKSPDNRVWFTVHGLAPLAPECVAWLRLLAGRPEIINKELDRAAQRCREEAGPDVAVQSGGEAAGRKRI